LQPVEGVKLSAGAIDASPLPAARRSASCLSSATSWRSHRPGAPLLHTQMARSG